jgi:hypothetical protein
LGGERADFDDRIRFTGCSTKVHSIPCNRHNVHTRSSLSMKHRNFFRRQASQLELADDQSGGEGDTVGFADFYTYGPGSLNLYGWLCLHGRLRRRGQDLGPWRPTDRGGRLGKSDRSWWFSRNDFLFGAGKIFPRWAVNLNRLNLRSLI